MTLLADDDAATAPAFSPAHLVDPGLLADIKRFGVVDVSACFSCGTCTAICPLSDNDGTFPRRIIRYGQVGMKDALLSSKEIWTCYHCGLCTESCPQQADPAEYMAATRRYAIASYDRTKLARTIYTRPVVGTAIAIVVAAFFAAFMYSSHGSKSSASLELFNFIPEHLIHWTGVAVFVLLAAGLLSGLATMVRGIARKEAVSTRSLLSGRGARRQAFAACWSAFGVEAVGQRRYRKDCDEAQHDEEPLWRRRWFAHALTVWGFLGLLAATLLDYGLSVVGLRKTGAPEPLWYPVRLLGTIAGLALVYGVSVLILNRLRRSNRAVQHSQASDWTLLALLWAVGVSGFLIELALYLPHAPAWAYWVFLFHVSFAMELMLMMPFMKFAHALYRPVALFFHALAAGRPGPAGAP